MSIERLYKTLRRLIPQYVYEETTILSSLSINEVVEYMDLDVERIEVKNLSEERLGYRDLSIYYPLSSLAESYGISVKVSFYEVSGLPIYYVHEPPLTETTKLLYIFVKDRISELSREKYSEVGVLIEGILNSINIPRSVLYEDEVKATIYYLWRDLYMHGIFTPLVLDPYIEEITWYGVDTVVKIVDREIQGIYPDVEFIHTNIGLPRNISRATKHYLMNNLIQTMNHKAGKGLTVVRPIVEARIPDTDPRYFHRLASHSSVLSNSSGLTIRKFPRYKLSIVDLIRYNTLTSFMASYLIYLLMNRSFILIFGGMGSGKTTLLQAIISMLPSTYKVLTIEDTPELSTPSDNWHPLYTRRAYGETELEDIDYTKLVKSALRHRARVIALGEVRGEEITQLIQASSTGHGCISTFHATTVEDTIRRMITPPMNLHPTNILGISSMVNIASTKAYIQRDGEEIVKSVKRVMNIYEPKSVNVETLEVDYERLYTWSPYGDIHKPVLDDIEMIQYIYRRSKAVRNIALSKYGEEDIARAYTELYLIKRVMDILVRNNIRDIKQSNRVFTRFISNIDKYVSRHREKIDKAIQNAV